MPSLLHHVPFTAWVVCVFCCFVLLSVKRDYSIFFFPHRVCEKFPASPLLSNAQNGCLEGSKQQGTECDIVQLLPSRDQTKYIDIQITTTDNNRTLNFPTAISCLRKLSKTYNHGDPLVRVE